MSDEQSLKEYADSVDAINLIFEQLPIEKRKASYDLFHSLIICVTRIRNLYKQLTKSNVKEKALLKNIRKLNKLLGDRDEFIKSLEAEIVNLNKDGKKDGVPK